MGRLLAFCVITFICSAEATANLASGRPLRKLALRRHHGRANSSHAGTSVANEPSDSARKVKLELFYETLCPSSQALLVNLRQQIWSDPELRSHVELHMYPFGNARAVPVMFGSGYGYGFQCQHGEAECFGNLIHSCAVDMLGDPDQYVPLFACMASYNQFSMDQVATLCANSQLLDAAPFLTCARSSQANLRMMEIAQYSSSLSPARSYAPWVVIDGQHVQPAEMGQLLQAVCIAVRASSGAALAACAGVPNELPIAPSSGQTPPTGACLGQPESQAA